MEIQQTEKLEDLRSFDMTIPLTAHKYLLRGKSVVMQLVDMDGNKLGRGVVIEPAKELNETND